MSCGKPTPVTVVPVQVLSGQSPSALQDTPDSGPPAQALTLGEGRPPDLVLGAECAVDDGGQVLPHVDAVDHLLQLDRIPALVEALVRVAELAEADLSPPPAVKGQGVVATVAWGRGGELAGE